MGNTTIIEVDGEAVACPRCGRLLLNDVGVFYPLCEHVRFIFVNGDAFEYIDPELERDLEEAKAAAGRAGRRLDVWDFLIDETGNGGSILQWSETGMACGPVSYEVWFGIR